MRKINYAIIGTTGIFLLIGGIILSLYESAFHSYLPLFMLFSSVLVLTLGGEYWAKYELNKRLGKYEDERTKQIEGMAYAKSYRVIRITFPLLFFLGRTSAFESLILLLFFSFILAAPLIWQVKLGKEL